MRALPSTPPFDHSTQLVCNIPVILAANIFSGIYFYGLLHYITGTLGPLVSHLRGIFTDAVKNKGGGWQYKQYSSDFGTWDQRSHAQHWLLFERNVGATLSIDEVSLSNGELWTFLTNKAGKGRKGTLVAAIRGTRISDIKRVLQNIPERLRMKVKEVSMDMAKNM